MENKSKKFLEKKGIDLDTTIMGSSKIPYFVKNLLVEFHFCNVEKEARKWFVVDIRKPSFRLFILIIIFAIIGALHTFSSLVIFILNMF